MMEKQPLTFPVLLDTEGITKIAYGTTGISECLIVDKNGVLIQKIIGARRWSGPAVFHFFRKIINPLTSKG